MKCDTKNDLMMDEKKELNNFIFIGNIMKKKNWAILLFILSISMWFSPQWN